MEDESLGAEKKPGRGAKKKYEVGTQGEIKRQNRAAERNRQKEVAR